MTIKRNPFPVLTEEQRADAVRRIMGHVTKQEDGCWIWSGWSNHFGHGRILIAGQGVMAHRALYELTVGPVPVELDLDHLCRVPACVNPAHLEPVTRHENLRRGPTTPTAMAEHQTHCKRGHEFTPENTRIRRDGWRNCKTCDRERVRRRWRLANWGRAER